MFEVDGDTDTYRIWQDLKGIWCCNCKWSANHYPSRCKHIKLVQSVGMTMKVGEEIWDEINTSEEGEV